MHTSTPLTTLYKSMEYSMQVVLKRVREDFVSLSVAFVNLQFLLYGNKYFIFYRQYFFIVQFP